MIESRGTLKLREYGRNIQNIVSHIKSVDNKEERTRLSYLLIDLMKQINPNYMDTEENVQKLWDHLFIISDYSLDIDAPFPPPNPTMVNRKPRKMPYAQKRIKFRVYGHNLELLIEKALEIEDPQKRKDAEVYLIRLMKNLSYSWNREVADDEVIAKQLKEISGGRLDPDIKGARESGHLEMSFKQSNQQGSSSNRNQSKGRRFRKRRN